MQTSDAPIVQYLWHKYLTSTRREIDDASEAYRAGTPPAEADRQATIVLGVAVAVLLITNFASDWHWFSDAAGFFGLDDPVAAITTTGNSQFSRLAWWAIVQISAYVGLPLLAIRFALKGKPSDYGATWSVKHARFYLGMLAISIPLIIAVSYTSGFQAKYPFYDLAQGETLWPYMWMWWVLYGLQFVALEFFFRGFIVHGLKHRFGYMAVIVMVVPYTMIHFKKPLLEAIGAVFGGTILGTMSLKTRSVWWGAALHITIAGTMDVLSLAQKGLL